MTRLAVQIAPQRNTQYAGLARGLAPHELALSPLAERIDSLQVVNLGGQEYLSFELDDAPDGGLDALSRPELATLAMTGAAFIYHESIAGRPGPFLEPLALDFAPALPREIVETRRYRGKTNEMFTHFLCNVARHASGLATRPWPTLRVFDPLAGGGTTLLTALMLGASAAGVEQNDKDMASTATFLRQYLQEQQISHQVKEERLKKMGQRWTFSIGKPTTQECLLARGDTVDSKVLLAGFRPHLIVTDLPYGIQHQGRLEQLLSDALPVWASLLPPSGALVYSWDATRFPREKMLDIVTRTTELKILDNGAYAMLGHPVDRVIKQREVLVARVRTPGR
jgi:hypothetical protein